MEVKIEIFAELTNEQRQSLVFIKTKRFESKEEITSFTRTIMDSFDKIYEQKITMKAKISIEPFEVEVVHLNKP